MNLQKIDFTLGFLFHSGFFETTLNCIYSSVFMHFLNETINPREIFSQTTLLGEFWVFLSFTSPKTVKGLSKLCSPKPLIQRFRVIVFF
jgi:hypothetical protein